MEDPPTLLPVPSPAPMPAVYSESFQSSPFSSRSDLPLQPPQKLRLMCSYGGRIMPRPHNKTLSYFGGDTRMIVVNRHISLADLRHRLSETILRDQSFSLKYQLPNEDLDSLISVTTDEDLENLVEEYDHLRNAGGRSKLSRLRLFLFPKTPSNVEELLVEATSTKSDDWFFKALNGKASALPATALHPGFSDTSSVNHLLGLEDNLVANSTKETQIDRSKIGNNVLNQEVHSVPDSPILETTSSSFGSSSSSLSAPNLPSIKVHVEENMKVGGLRIEDQFQQLSVVVKQEETRGYEASGEVFGGVGSSIPMVMVVDGENANQVILDDEGSNHDGYNRVQLMQQQQIPRIHLKQTAGFDLHSPDSVSSEVSYTNSLYWQRQTMYQEPITQMPSVNTTADAHPADPKTGDQNNAKVQMQPQIQESGYVLSGQYDQSHSQLHQRRQFVHPAANQYITAGAGAVPVASLYPVYHSQQQYHPHQPIYFVSARPVQAYNIPVQQLSYGDPVPSSHPQTSQGAALAGYSQTANVPFSKPEMDYRTASGAAPQLVQIPSSQHQPQYVGFAQIQLPSQPINPPSAASPTHDQFADPSQVQMHYARHLLPHQLAAQYTIPTSSPLQ